ncbi:MAG: prepilin peptidase [Asticcacaulis sp.]
MLVPAIFCLIYPVCLFWAAFSDLKSMTIPNRLSIVLALGFFPAAILLGLSPMLMLQHAGIGLIGLVIGFTLFAFRFLGGGDAKLIAATAIWLPWNGAVAFVIYTALLGGAFTILLLIARQALQIYTPTMPQWLQTLLKPKGDLPYGVAICAGGLIVIPQTELYIALMKLIG